MKNNRTFRADKYQVLTNGVWINTTVKKGRALLSSGDYKGIDLFDNDMNYIAEGLFFSPQVKQVEKHIDLEKGLNELMNKYA